MPAMQTVAGHLNHAFDKDHIKETAKHRDAFSQGKKLADGVKLLLGKQKALSDVLLPYVSALPGGIQESARSIIYFALDPDSLTHITFSWAPGYDAEMSIWQAPDTRATSGGITVLLKSRYPGDEHPVSSREEKSKK
jgi:hypothetical protein